MRPLVLVLIALLTSQATFGQSDYLPTVTLPFRGNGTIGDFGDIDGDGDNDIIFATGNSLSVLYNDAGEFTRLQNLVVTKSGPLAMTIHDVDSDGISDIVVALPKDKISVYSYKVDGFKEINSISLSSVQLGATQIHCDDLNNDNILDFILSFTLVGNFVWELESKSDGSYLARKITTEIDVMRSRLSDIDQDGDIDLLVSDYSGTTISINKNVNGDFFPNEKAFAYGSALEFIVSEFNGDGLPDLAVLDVSGYIEYFEQQSDGTFPRKWKSVVGAGAGLFSSDVDNDGDEDLIIGPSWAETVVKTMTNDGHGVFSVDRTIPLMDYAYPVVAGDVDGDQIPEILPLARSSHIELFKRGTDRYTSYLNFIFASNPSGKGQLADMNNDGKLDLVLLHTEAKAISIALGTGDANLFSNPIYFKTGEFIFPAQVEIGDFNNDSRPDIIYVCFETSNRSSPSGIIYGYENGDFVHVKYEERQNVNSSDLHVADFNNDGIDDFLSGSIFLNNGNGSFTEQVVTSGNAIDGETVGDFNNDGAVDLALANSQTISIQKNDGTGTFESVAQFNSTGIVLETLSAFDINGDQLDDIIYYSSVAKALIVMINVSNNAFVKKTISYGTTLPPIYTVNDFDADDIPEVAIFQFGLMKMYHVNSESSPVLTQTVELSDSFYGFDALSGPINNDNLPDIVVINYNYPSSALLSKVLSAPTISPSNISVSDRTRTSAKISFTSGNGDGRIVIIREAEPVDTFPVDGEFYTGSGKIGDGDELAPGNFVVAAGDQTSVNLSGLKEGTTYYLSLFESNQTATRIKYFTSQSTTGSFKTKATQTISFEIPTKTMGDTDFDADGITSSGLPLTYSYRGGGAFVSGSTISIVAPGRSIIRADQMGDDEFEPAYKEAEFCINPIKPFITITSDQGQTALTVTNTPWEDANTWYVNGEQLKDFYENKIIPIDEGVYTASTSSEGCTSEISDPFVYVGISEKSSGISISPNPTVGNLFITIDPAESIYPSIIDMTGRITTPTVTRTADGLELNVESLNSGLYYLQIRPGLSYKFVKE